jgi:hypothetical protein
LVASRKKEDGSYGRRPSTARARTPSARLAGPGRARRRKRRQPGTASSAWQTDSQSGIVGGETPEVRSSQSAHAAAAAAANGGRKEKQ